MKRILKLIPILLIVFLSFMATGCATIKPLPTPSGRPEVTIPNVTKKQVIDTLTNRMINKGYQLSSVNDYVVVFNKKVDSFMAGVIYGSRYDSTPAARVSYNLVETDAGIRVIVTLEVVTNPGSAFERVTDLSQGPDAKDAQRSLEEVKASLIK